MPRVALTLLALGALSVHAAEPTDADVKKFEGAVREAGEEKEECPRHNCRCGDKHPGMDRKGHAHMECDVDVQGIQLKILQPGPWEYHGGAYWTDIPKYAAPKVLPPWGRNIYQNNTPPVSLYDFKPGSTVVDIGAGYGVWTLMIAKAFPEVKVIAVEPVGWQASLLEENAKRNGVADRVKVVSKPVTKDGRDVTFYQQMLYHFLSNIHSRARMDIIHCGETTSHANPDTKTISVKELTEMAGGKISFAKIDCVGCEHEIGQLVADMDIPFEMECWAGADNSKYAGREWQDLASLTMFGQKEGEACLDLQDLGEARMLQWAADEGRSVERGIVGLQLLSEGNRSSAIEELARSIGMNQAVVDAMPTGGVKEQYVILREAIKSIASFFVASAMENGEGTPQNIQGAAEMFRDIAVAEAKLLALDADLAILHDELPMLHDVMSGSMYRLAEILAKQGNLEEAKDYYSQAAQMGHGLAAARLDSFPKTDLVGTNGRVAGAGKRQLISQVQLEALGVPAALHQPLMGSAASEMFDECMRNDQEKSVPRWEDVFKGKGSSYEAMGAYRFRSWFHSAMGCWLGA